MKLPFGLTPEELHCFVLGFNEGMNPRKPSVPYPEEVLKMIEGEFWYYGAGFALAAVIWFFLGLGAVFLILWVIL